MKYRWPEERIRQELELLDRMTGLEGAALPIRFSNSERTLGTFHAEKDGKGSFTFSRAYLESEIIPEEVNRQTIRHEYAHYMDWAYYGRCGHSKTWKKCCGEINTVAIRCYNPEDAYHFQKIQDRLDADARICAEYHEGDRVFHPGFGPGQIRAVRDVRSDRILEILFEAGAVKRLSAKWIHENCLVEEA